MISPAMPEMPTGFWTPEKLELMWFYMKWFLKENQMFVMIFVAISLSGTLLMMVSGFFDRSSQKDNDEDDYDYREI